MSLFGRRSRSQHVLSDQKFQFVPVLESLESRTLMSATLSATVPGPIPASAISGLTVNDKISINVANAGPDAEHGRATLTLFASSDQTLDAGDAQITTHTVGLSIGAGKNKSFKLNVKAFPMNLSGDYFIIGEAVASSTVVASSVSTINVIPAQIDLSGLVTKVPNSAKIGKHFALTIEVANSGNVLANGNLAVALGISTSPSGTAPVALQTSSKHIHIKAGKQQVLHLSVLLPPGSPSGNQYIVATVDPSNVFLDPNLANNTNVSQTPISVT